MKDRWVAPNGQTSEDLGKNTDIFTEENRQLKGMFIGSFGMFLDHFVEYHRHRVFHTRS